MFTDNELGNLLGIKALEKFSGGNEMNLIKIRE